jgi:hypothetical protein
VKKIVELLEQTPGITPHIASLKLMKDGEVWGTTARRSGESSPRHARPANGWR